MNDVEQSPSDIIRKVSEHTGIHKETVETVLNGFTDVFISEVVNYGQFRWKNVLTISAFKNEGSNKISSQRATDFYLKAALSQRVRALWKIRLLKYNADSTIITPENWRKVYNHHIPEFGLWREKEELKKKV